MIRAALSRVVRPPRRLSSGQQPAEEVDVVAGHRQTRWLVLLVPAAVVTVLGHLASILASSRLR